MAIAASVRNISRGAASCSGNCAIAATKNVAASGAGYVTRFAVRREFLAKYRVRTVGASVHQELWIPAEDLPEMNRNIEGLIEVIEEYRADATTLK